MGCFGLFPWDSSLVFSPAKKVEVGGGSSRSPISRSSSESPDHCSRSPVYSPRHRSPDSSSSESPDHCSRRRSPVHSPRHTSPDPSSSESPDSRSRRYQLPIKIYGTKVDIVSLLCSSRRDYLVDKDGNRISVSSLVNNGKYLIICCFEVPVKSFSNYGEICWALKSALSTPLWSNHCQLVVALKIKSIWKRKHKYNNNNNYLLDSFLSALPNSLAIPFWDTSSYHRLSEFLRPLECYAPALVLNPDHIVLNQHFDDIVENGADSFPFTHDHLSNLLNTTVFNWSKLRPVPLEDVLGLRPTDSLSNLSATATISVSDLKRKLVGLYLFRHGHLSTKIDTIYKQCQTSHRELEIVIVYLSFNDNPLHFMASANEFLKKRGISSSWWVLPFHYPTSRRLWNLCSETIKDELVIVGPQGQFLEKKGVKFITEFDPVVYDMYPYAAEAIAKRETSRLQNLTLESLLFSEEHDDYLLTRKGDRINVNTLQGKRVLLFVANLGQNYEDEDEDEDRCSHCSDQKIIGDWCKANRKYYIDNNKSGEIILVLVPLFISNEELLDSEVSMAWLWDSKMPWLICPPDDPVREARLIKDTTLYGFDIVDDRSLCFTFREDGRIVSKAWPRQLSQHNWAEDNQLYAQILSTYTDKLDYDSYY